MILKDLKESIFYQSAESALFCDKEIDFVLTSRFGGESLPPYHSLNVSYHIGDEATYVSANHHKIMQKFFPHKQLLYLNQIHSHIVLDSAKALQNANTQNQQSILLGNADGIICNDVKYVGLVVVADCNPILLYAPKSRIFALLHAGRKGVCERIVTHAVTKIHNDYGVEGRDIFVFIGASIRSCCYEVGKDMACDITRLHGAQYIHSKNNHTMLDMLAMLQDECLDLGIAPNHIEILESCSCCEEALFSYRREGQTGRFGLFASLKS